MIHHFIKLLIIQGPNLNLLDQCQLSLYYHLSLETLHQKLSEQAKDHNFYAIFLHYLQLTS